MLKKQYDSFVRARQAATQSYKGYGEVINIQQRKVGKVLETVDELMTKQGGLIEAMAAAELTARRDRLTDMRTRARFAMADSYDRATRTALDKGE